MKKKTFWSKWMGKLKIRDKYIIFLVPFIIVASLVIFVTMFFSSFRETKNIVDDQADISAAQKAQLINNYIEKLRMESEIFMFDSGTQKRLMIRKSLLGSAEQYELQEDIRQNMYNMIINYDVNVESIAVRNINGDFYLWKMDSSLPHEPFSSRLSSLDKETRRLDGGIYFSYAKIDEGLITMSRIIKDPISGVEIGILMIDFNLNFLNNISHSANKTEPTLLIKYSGSGTLFNSSPLPSEAIAMLSPESTTLTVGTEKYKIDYAPSLVNEWQIFMVTNESLLYRNINKLLILQALLLFMLMVLIIFAICKVSGTISKQFQYFIKKVSHTTKLNEQALITIDSQDEFCELAKVYNEMLLRINDLINTVYSKELLVKSAELKAFQAQINPHFLYNTLDCINGLVEMNRPDDIKKIVSALADIMRMSIKGSETLTVRENLKYINEYIYIEKVRYQDKLIFLSDIPESILDYYIPKLIIQPILENSIQHGISDKIDSGMIGLFAREENSSISFTVKDNGCGIPQEIIDLINNGSDYSISEQSVKQSIGLQNIQARIQLMYGKSYGLTLKNIPSGGSSVTVYLPKITSIETNGIARKEEEE